MSENIKEWSMRMARKELGHDVSAGGFGIEDTPRPIDTSAAASPVLIESRVAFAKFVELMRRKRGMTIEQLADSCGIEVSDVVSIEDEMLHGIGPRTVYQIAQCFDVSDTKLMQLAGLTQIQDSSLAEQSLRFAARSNSMASLTKEEREALDQFVAELGRGR